MELTWPQAEKVLDSTAVVVIPLGAGSKEHGPHLPLATDMLQAEWYTDQLATTEQVVIAPLINYGYYYFFTEFPGSTSIRFTAARDMVVDICRGLAAFGPKRFYVINIGVSTVPVLKAAAIQLAQEGVVMRFTNLSDPRLKPVEDSLFTQKEGTHADEAETSVMLHMYPAQVDMSKAVQEYSTRNGMGIMQRVPGAPGRYAPSGIYGDATLATSEKGGKMASALLAMMREDLAGLKGAAIPEAKRTTPLDAYVGSYAAPDSAMFTITIVDGRLSFLDVRKGLRALLYDEGDDHFAGYYTDVRFHRNDAGRLDGLGVVLIDGTRLRAERVEQ
jgi:creatinine amidohydrolase